MEELLEQLRQVEDPREPKGLRHLLEEILFIALVAMVAGADDAESMHVFGEANLGWFEEILTLPHGMPSQDTFLRIFAMLKPAAVHTLFQNWILGLREHTPGGHIAIDGKCLRRTFDRATGSKAIHTLSAWLSSKEWVLGQVKVDEKENEIVAIPELLRLLDLRQVTVTIDAIGCQRAIAEQIVDDKGDYILTVKDSQPTLREEIEAHFSQPAPAAPAPKGARQAEPVPMEKHQDVDAGHGRIETRTTTLSRNLRGLSRKADWKGLTGIAMVERERIDKISGKTSLERSYYIVSDPKATAESVGRAIRSHWGIENSLHWVLDVTFREDQCRIRAGNAAENLSVMRHLVMNLMRTAPGKKRSMAKRRQLCGWNREFLLSVLLGREVES